MKRAALRSSFFGLMVLCAFSKCCSTPNRVAPPSSSEKTAHLNVYEEPETLDPRRCRTLKDLTIVMQLFEGLVRLGENEVPELALAESVSVSEDGLHYLFKLKPSVWSDGSPLKAQDFEYAWKKVLDPLFACEYSHMFYSIKNAKQAREGKCSLEEVGVKALDARTLTVDLQEFTPFFLELLAFPTFFPLPAGIDEHKSTWAKSPYAQFICNGPFLLQSLKDQYEIVFAKNPSYWDCDHVYLDTLYFSVISDPTTEAELYFQGKLDWLGQPFSNSISPEILSKLKQEHALNSYNVMGTKWIQFNTKKTPFHNQKLRQAFNLALCREEIVDHLLIGQQKVALGILPYHLSTNTQGFFKDADIKLAKELFDEALIEEGWTKTSLPSIVLLFCSSERDSKIFQQVQSQWENCFGIKIDLKAVEHKVYSHLIQTGDYQIGPGEWVADFNNPLSFLDFFSSSMNTTQWKDVQFYESVQKLHEEKNLQKREEYAFCAENLLVNQMPVAPLYHYAFDFTTKAIEGVLLSSQGLADFKSAKKKEMHNCGLQN